MTGLTVETVTAHKNKEKTRARLTISRTLTTTSEDYWLTWMPVLVRTIGRVTTSVTKRRRRGKRRRHRGAAKAKQKPGREMTPVHLIRRRPTIRSNKKLPEKGPEVGQDVLIQRNFLQVNLIWTTRRTGGAAADMNPILVLKREHERDQASQLPFYQSGRLQELPFRQRECAL